MLFTSLTAHAVTSLPTTLLDRPVLVQELGQDANVINEAVDIISTSASQDGNAQPVSPGPDMQSWLGACFRTDGRPCTRLVELDKNLSAALAHTSGRLNLPPPSMQEKMPKIQFIYTTAVEKNETDQSSLVSIKMSLSETVSLYRISPAEAFMGLDVRFQLPMADISDRRAISEVDAGLAKLAPRVFQIQMTGDSADSSLGGVTRMAGTGFFISADGYFLTNHHVIEGNPNCLTHQICHVRTDAEGKRVKMEFDATLLATDKVYDFAPFKSRPAWGHTDRACRIGV